MPVREVSAHQLARALEAPEAERPLVLDVRNPDEVRVASIPGSLNVPLHELPARLDEVRLASDNVMDIIKNYDVIVNCGDNFPTRYLINDACVLARKPLVDGAIFRFEGNATVFYPAKGGPCYRCLYPEPAPPDMAPSCAEAGVLGVLPGLIGLVQANEVLKLLLGIGTPLVGRLLTFDALGTRFSELSLRRDPACPTCRPGAIITLSDAAPGCEVPDARA